MSGPQYLEAIKRELDAGRHQHRMGENLLAAFGYVRRGPSAIHEINSAMKVLGLVANTMIDRNMPLRNPRVRFSLASSLPNGDEPTETVEVAEGQALEPEPFVDVSLTASFRIGELAAADKLVECIALDAPLARAYTVMSLNKYSQLVVANGDKPRRQDIKGHCIVSINR